MGPPVQRGGYFPVKDYMEHYKVLPQQEDEYHRKLRQEIERNENSLSHFKDSEPHYKTNFTPNAFSKQDIDDFQDSLLKQVLNELSEKIEITPNVYETTKEVTETLEQNPDVPIVELTQKLLAVDDDISQFNHDLDKLDIEMSKELLDTQEFLQDINEIAGPFPQRKLNDSEVSY